MAREFGLIASRRQVLGDLGLTGLALILPGCKGEPPARSAAAADWSGERLYEAVREYSAMGAHRVGTAVDAQTNQWFADQLRAMGGEIEMQPFKFDRFDGDTEVTIDGATIPSMPLYYEAVGDATSDTPHTAALKVTKGDRASEALENAIAKAKAAGATVAVIATEGAGGELSTPNCYPKLGSPGHEILHHIGLERYLEANRVTANLIMHLGANVAVGQKDPKTGAITLAPGVSNPRAIPTVGRAVFVRMDEARFNTIRPELATADLPAVLNPPSWNGEGELWANASRSDLMSFTGIHPLFHTSGDMPESTTSPEALATVYQGVARAVSKLLLSL